MCKILEREGRQWAVDSITQLQELAGKNDRYQQLINYLQRGTNGKPPSFVAGVQGVIDELRQIGRAA
ncbi:hypothetical protein V2I84_05385 [Pseudomonas viridiflava]|uniref:hypothetical protein n=1 Tax=Pseudomonas viridiflava TaxID=33069 RepID=UPI002EA85B58|nr:hypothetical protein [Pseudomonas viridiflava]MEE3980887.1 hypothetical protein [Pseudomonas viridiflava]MEE3989621.1 hypothetical protein [Pseudomonas viridiflava]MEE4028167.1 hypothetical protein [Pseudomonas viridiflava]MEE4034331.1 hypothetical protein [Pseudomonas viridiflava]